MWRNLWVTFLLRPILGQWLSWVCKIAYEYFYLSLIVAKGEALMGIVMGNGHRLTVHLSLPSRNQALYQHYKTKYIVWKCWKRLIIALTTRMSWPVALVRNKSRKTCYIKSWIDCTLNCPLQLPSKLPRYNYNACSSYKSLPILSPDCFFSISLSSLYTYQQTPWVR